MPDQHVVGTGPDQPRVVPVVQSHVVPRAESFGEMAADRVGRRDPRPVRINEMNRLHGRYGDCCGNESGGTEGGMTVGGGREERSRFPSRAMYTRFGTDMKSVTEITDPQTTPGTPTALVNTIESARFAIIIADAVIA